MAESLRPSRTCTIHYPEAYGDPDIFAGGFHIHLLIEFDDGVKWLARIRQTSSHLMSNEEGIIVTESAITTQHVMHKAGLKVADAWPFTGFSDGASPKKLKIRYSHLPVLDRIDYLLDGIRPRQQLDG